MLGQGFFQYPPPKFEQEFRYGIYPTDFLIEAIIRSGLEWFLNTPEAPNQVFGHLTSPLLDARYGQAKIDEIAAYIRKYEITVVQHFSLMDTRVPAISIQLLDGSEAVERAALADFQTHIDSLDASNAVKGRVEVGFSPIIDNVHIGIHSIDTPDLTKYLYYLVAYVLNVFKPEFDRLGIYLTTFRATDISRLNDYLPENMYSRFINFQALTLASYDRGTLPIIEKILGVHVPQGPDADSANISDTEIEVETGLSLSDIKQSGGRG